jgi:hypothetical protein
LFFDPVIPYYSKQMPPCQKLEKESLMPVLFMVNENLGMLMISLGYPPALGMCFSLYKEKPYETRQKK